jgi:inosine/xanthosine triphosphate pyrophosphatase family protein
MQIFIATVNKHKEPELSRYFKNIGLKTTHIYPKDVSNLPSTHSEYMCVREQTTLISKKTGVQSLNDKFEEVVHTSIIQLDSYSNGTNHTSYFQASVEGMIFPNLRKNNSELVFGWDDIFVSSKTMKTYQEMKSKGLKNSARDIAFSKMIDSLPHIFQYSNKVNLNFNPVEIDEVISFEPFIKQLFDNNQYYSIAYKNNAFRSIINHVLNEGLFIRRASDRKQRNYWLPGLNAGIPLTPKKDELHELTFMFHDIMHFIFPDLIVVSDDKQGKHKYIISRMMSEAFTLVLADMIFISLLKESGIEYDYNKRKIYPLFENIKFEINSDSLSQLKQLLWANVNFAVLGNDDELRALVKNDRAVDSYKEKYQRFFQEDYRWTNSNYSNIAIDSNRNKKWIEDIYAVCGNVVPTTENYCENLIEGDFESQVKIIFEEMFSKLESIISSDVQYKKELALSNAIKRYSSGQMALFYRFETLYNELFIQQISSILKKEIIDNTDLQDIKALYDVYIGKLVSDDFITEYEAKSFKNIYPMFSPFYVFYDQSEEQTFHETLNAIFR